MVEVKKYDIKPEHVDAYYKRLTRTLEFCVSRHLAGKAEAGTTRSEKGYQLIAANTAGRLARALGCSEMKTKNLCMAVGMCFPQYGQEGFRAVKQYIADQHIDLELQMLEVTFAEYLIRKYRELVSTEFHEMLCAYFSGEEGPDEVRIVRFVQELIKDIKKAEVFYDGYSGDLLYDVTQEAVEVSQKKKELMRGSILADYDEKVAAYQPPQLAEEERSEVYQTLDRYIREFDGNPEEVVLTYIYLYD